MSCTSSLPPLCVATVADPRVLRWSVVHATSGFLMLPHNSFYFFLIYSDTRYFAPSCFDHRQLGGFQWFITLLRKSKLIKMVFQPCPTPPRDCPTLHCSFIVTIFFPVTSARANSFPFPAFLFFFDVGSLATTRINFFLGPYLPLATHYWVFSANLTSWRKPSWSVPVSIGWVLWYLCKTL